MQGFYEFKEHPCFAKSVKCLRYYSPRSRGAENRNEENWAIWEMRAVTCANMETPPPPPPPPTGFSPYPRPGRSVPVPSGTVRFEALGEAWRYLTEDIWGWLTCSLMIAILIGVPLFIIIFVINFMVLQGSQFTPGQLPSAQQSQMSNLITAIFSIPITAVAFLMVTGLQNRALGQLKSGIQPVNSIFKLNGASGRIICFGAVLGLVSFCEQFLLPKMVTDPKDPFSIFTPTYFLAIFAMMILGTSIQVLVGFSPLLCVDKNLSLVDAVQTSFSTMKRHFLSYFGLYLLGGLCACLGVFACCFGILFTMNLSIIISAVVYYDLFTKPTAKTEVQ